MNSKDLVITSPDLIIDNITLGYIAKSNIHGYGLFASERIDTGTILGVLDGQVVSWDQYDKICSMLSSKTQEASQYIFMEWNALSQDQLLVRPLRTKYSFINHSRQPNVRIIRNPLQLIAIRSISKDDEFVLDYREEPLREEYVQGHGKSYL